LGARWEDDAVSENWESTAVDGRTARGLQNLAGENPYPTARNDVPNPPLKLNVEEWLSVFLLKAAEGEEDEDDEDEELDDDDLEDDEDDEDEDDEEEDDEEDDE
jgi:hypothetical protein